MCLPIIFLHVTQTEKHTWLNRTNIGSILKNTDNIAWPDDELKGEVEREVEREREVEKERERELERGMYFPVLLEERERGQLRSFSKSKTTARNTKKGEGDDPVI